MIAEGRYSHSGTYNANVVQCAAVSATMDVLAEPGLFERQRALGERLAQGLQTWRRRTASGSRRRSRARSSSSGSPTPHPELARRRGTPTRRAHALVPGDVVARRPVPPEPVREPVRLAGARRRRRRPDARRGGRGVPHPGGREDRWIAVEDRSERDCRGGDFFFFFRGQGGCGTATSWRLVERLIAEERLAPADGCRARGGLAEMAGVSLITVRRALAELEQEGRVHSHQGLGTFVARPRIVSEPRRGRRPPRHARRGARRARDHDAHPRHRARRPPRNLAHALQLGAGRRVWQRAPPARHRRPPDDRRAGRDPRLPGARPRCPHGRGRRLAVPPAGSPLRARRRLRGAVPRGRRSEHRGAPSLDLARGDQIVRLRGVSFDARNRPFDCFQHVYPAAEVVFSISGSDRPPRVPRQRPARLERRAGRRRPPRRFCFEVEDPPVPGRPHIHEWGCSCRRASGTRSSTPTRPRASATRSTRRSTRRAAQRRVRPVTRPAATDGEPGAATTSQKAPAPLVVAR